MRTAGIVLLSAVCALAQPLHLEKLGTYETKIFNGSAAEIPAYDPATKRVFVVNAALNRVDVLDISNPKLPSFLFPITPPASCGASPNSVAVKNGLVAIAVESNPKTDPGFVVFSDANGQNIRCVQAGALPDMVDFTPDGKYVLSANEGEPNDGYSIDPEGSVTIVDVSGGLNSIDQTKVRTASLTRFNAPAAIDSQIRIFGPGASVAQDLEPEYIAFSPDSKTAYVVCQENNAIAILDISAGEFMELKALGYKNHSLPGNALDTSDRDNAINIANWPVLGMYQPDAIATFQSGGKTYILTANEGDARDYAGFSEEVRVNNATYVLDPGDFPNAAALKQQANLGRLNVTRATGDDNGDGKFNRIFVFGARSISVWDDQVKLVYDSGDEMEKLTAKLFPANFNASNSNNNFDDRSDNKGPEPEALAIGTVGNTQYAFVGLERIGGVMAYALTNPTAPKFVHYSNNRNFGVAPSAGTADGTVGDLGIEGIVFIPPADSPNGKTLLVTANETSGTTTIFQVSPLTNLAGKIAVQIGGFVFNRVTDTWFATIVVRNTTSSAIPGPIFGAFDNLPSGVELVQPAGLLDTGFYKKLSETGLSRNQAITLRVEFQNPANTRISFTPAFYN